MTAKHTPAAFINAIADEGTKDEAVRYLQQTWNEQCELIAALRLAIDQIDAGHWDAADHVLRTALAKVKS